MQQLLRHRARLVPACSLMSERQRWWCGTVLRLHWISYYCHLLVALSPRMIRHCGRREVRERRFCFHLLNTLFPGPTGSLFMRVLSLMQCIGMQFTGGGEDSLREFHFSRPKGRKIRDLKIHHSLLFGALGTNIKEETHYKVRNGFSSDGGAN